MRKQYIDFVPAGKPATRSKPVRRTVGKAAEGVADKRSLRKVEEPNLGEVAGFSSEKKPKLGAVEDLHTKFVKTDVPKRPLSRPHFRAAEKTGVKAAKAQKVGMKASGKTALREAVSGRAVSGKVVSSKAVEKPVEKSDKQKKVGTYQAPKTPFINQGKVQKRPLSKNVYAKKELAATKEASEPKGPVTIISKPEKQAHVGMIVTIILTIILGAAAGTVAFLLLPK